MNFFITVWFIVGLTYHFSTTDQIVGTQKLIKMRNIDAMPLKNLIFYILIELSLLWMNLNCKKSKSTKFTLYIWFWWIIKKKNTFYHKFKISLNNNDLFIKKKLGSPEPVNLHIEPVFWIIPEEHQNFLFSVKPTEDKGCYILSKN